MWYSLGLILFFIFYFVLARKRLDWALMLLLVGLPSYLLRFNVFGIPFTVLEGMILTSFFVWFFYRTNFKKFLKGEYFLKDYLENKKKRINYPFGTEASLVILISFLAVVISGFSQASLGAWKAYFFEPLLLFILILNVFQDKKGIRKIIFSLSISALAVSLYAVWQKITGLGIANPFWANIETRRVVSFFGYPNAIGLYLAPIILVITGYLFKNISTKRTRENIFFSLTIFLSLLAIYFARSEGALIAVVGSLFVFALFADRIIRMIAIAIFIIVLGLVSFNQPISEYLINKATLMDLSGQIRRQQWSETWKMLSNGRMVVGAGLSNYQNKIAPFHQEGIFFNDGDPDFRRKIVIFDDKYRAEHWQPVETYLYPHNIFLNFWTELGLAGVILFFWLFIKAIYIGIKNFIKVRKKEDIKIKFLSLGFACAVLTMIIHGLVDVPYFKNDLSVLFWVFLAVIALIQLKAEKIKNRNKITIKKHKAK